MKGGREWIKYKIDEDRLIYNELAGGCAGREGQRLKRPEGLQAQDAATSQEANLVSLSAALIESRCWQEREPSKIKDNDCKKIKAAHITKIEQHRKTAERPCANGVKLTLLAICHDADIANVHAY